MSDPIWEEACKDTEKEKLKEIVYLLRQKVDAVRNLCDRNSHESDTVLIADVLKVME